jgi:hypothetical protein
VYLRGETEKSRNGFVQFGASIDRRRGVKVVLLSLAVDRQHVVLLSRGRTLLSIVVTVCPSAKI